MRLEWPRIAAHSAYISPHQTAETSKCCQLGGPVLDRNWTSGMFGALHGNAWLRDTPFPGREDLVQFIGEDDEPANVRIGAQVAEREEENPTMPSAAAEAVYLPARPPIPPRAS